MLRGCPTQTGPLFVAVAIGKAFTMAIVVAVFEQPLALTTVRVYIPAIAMVAEADTTGD
jgi:hypothetical protein